MSRHKKMIVKKKLKKKIEFAIEKIFKILNFNYFFNFYKSFFHYDILLLAHCLFGSS